MASFGDYILEDAYSSIKDFWGFLSPMFYVVSVKLQNGSYYQTDVYLMSFNDSLIANELEKGMENNLNDILVHDKNATKRGNHVLLLPFNGVSSMYEAVKQMPTIKKYMGATIFEYQERNKWWIWIVIGSILIFIFIVTTLTVILWKYRKWKKIMQKYSWAVDSGISVKEANTFVEAGKELFIGGSFITADFDNIVGKGSSAVVYEGLLSTISPIANLYPRLETRNFSNCKLAIKIGNTFSKNEFEQIFREVEAAMKIGWHRHICCLLGWSVYQSMPVLMFELIEGKDLLSWAQSFQDSSVSDEDNVSMTQSDQDLDSVKNEVKMMQSIEDHSTSNAKDVRMMQSFHHSFKKVIPEKSVTQILWQISDGMEYIASLGILHKDLAARNILLSQRLEAKITDFGLATTSSCKDDETSSIFTYEAPIQRRLPLRWMAPEALKNRTFSEFSDVWSFGTLAWEVFSKGKIPYGTIDGNDILDFLLAGNRLKIPEEVSEGWKKLLMDCWNEEREERPSFKSIKSQIGAFLETQTINYGYLITTFDEKENA
uniref:Protein kinase domain-containing protein n=1 Tax=Panagrolaimus sp. ES5 TaxID=591445 RepID=A0AC34FK65_9BILA